MKLILPKTQPLMGSENQTIQHPEKELNSKVSSRATQNTHAGRGLDTPGLQDPIISRFRTYRKLERFFRIAVSRASRKIAANCKNQIQSRL